MNGFILGGIKWHQMTVVINQEKGRWSLVWHLKADVRLYEEGGGSGAKPININLMLEAIALFILVLSTVIILVLYEKSSAKGWAKGHTCTTLTLEFTFITVP